MEAEAQAEQTMQYLHILAHYSNCHCTRAAVRLKLCHTANCNAKQRKATGMWQVAGGKWQQPHAALAEHTEFIVRTAGDIGLWAVPHYGGRKCDAVVLHYRVTDTFGGPMRHSRKVCNAFRLAESE